MPPKPKNVKKIFNSLADLAEIKSGMPSGREHFSNPFMGEIKASLGVKPTIVGREKVTYIRPTPTFSTYEKDRFNAFQKYYNMPGSVYSTMPREDAMKSFFAEYDRRHDATNIDINNLLSQIDRQIKVYGQQYSPDIINAMKSVVRTNPEALRTDVPGTKFAPYSTNPEVSSIPDFFDPRSYRGISNIDDMFHNAGVGLDMIGLQGKAKDRAPKFSMQALSAGLSDSAALLGLPGYTRTIFPYGARASKVPATPALPTFMGNPYSASNMFTLFPSNPSTYKTSQEVLDIPDFFDGRKYRGISNLDRNFFTANFYNTVSPQPEVSDHFLNKGLQGAAWLAGVPGAPKVDLMQYKPRKK